MATGKSQILVHLVDLDTALMNSIDNFDVIKGLIEDSLINDNLFDSLSESKIYSDVMINYNSSINSLISSILSLKRSVQASRIANVEVV